MTARLLLGSLLLVAIAMAQDSDVIELGDDNFTEKTKDVDMMLIEFFAPWCGHCKRLAPEYEKAATQLLNSDPPVPIAKMDCTERGKATCSKYGVSGYPTLKIFRNGEFSSDYQGPRTADGIVSTMSKQAGPSAVEVTSADQLKAKLEKYNDHCIVGFFSDGGNEVAKAFHKAADSERETFKFVFTVDADTAAEYGYNDQIVIFQPVKMITKMEPSQLAYDGDANSKAIIEFVKANFMGLAGLRTTDNAVLFEKPLVVVYFDIDYERNPKGSNYWRNRVIKVAKEFPDINFCVSDKTAFNKELTDLGQSSEAAVAAGIYDNSGKYSMETEFSVDNLRQFVEQYNAGELELYIKSEPVPEDNNGPVTVVVGKNFDEIVNDDTKDVLIEFYAPWCGHCKSLAPIYEELGEKLMDDPNIVIAKCDATANDLPPSYEVRGFPTLFWVPAGKKDSPVKYEGGREVADFIKYIKDNATNPPIIAGEKDKKNSKKSKKEL